MRRLLLASLGLSLLATSFSPRTASADRPGFDRREPGFDRREPGFDRGARADDRFDYARLRGLLARYDRARAVYDVRQLQALEGELRGLVADELRESYRELAQDRRDAMRRRVPLAAGYETALEAQQLSAKRGIAAELDAVIGRQDPAALAYRRERIVRLLALGGQELADQQPGQPYQPGQPEQDRRIHHDGRRGWR